MAKAEIDLPCSSEVAAVVLEQAAEIERLQEDAKQQERVIAGLNKQLTEQFALSTKYVGVSERLRAALKGIAEYCSGDGQPLGAIERLAAIRNTAEHAVRALEQKALGKEGQ